MTKSVQTGANKLGLEVIKWLLTIRGSATAFQEEWLELMASLILGWNFINLSLGSLDMRPIYLGCGMG